jgi:carbonic anhydrase
MIRSGTIVCLLLAGMMSACKGGHSRTEVFIDTTHREGMETVLVHSEHASTADEVLARLKEGNHRFISKLSPTNITHDSSYTYFDQIAHTRNEQHPIACVLTCMDSRVPPEIIFDQGIGSLFSVRVAGNIEDPDVLGSMEYAVAEKGVKLIVVMGHKNCGAISAAFAKLDPDNKELVSLIGAVKKDIVPGDKPPYDASAKHNVKLTIDNILAGSKTIRDRHASGGVVIVGALYDVANGTIDWNTQDW